MYPRPNTRIHTLRAPALRNSAQHPSAAPPGNRQRHHLARDRKLALGSCTSKEAHYRRPQEDGSENPRVPAAGVPRYQHPPAGRHGCDLSSSSSPGTAQAFCYQFLQATLQITHLAQISPVSVHLTVMLLMFYFTVTPNLRLYCTMFCHFFRCKINKEEGTD